MWCAVMAALMCSRLATPGLLAPAAAQEPTAGPSRALLVARSETDFIGGHHIFHTRLVLVQPDGSLRELVGAPAGRGRFSPDGSLVAWTDDSVSPPEVHVITPEGGARPGVDGSGGPLAQGELGEQAWSPDGRRLLLAVDHDTTPRIVTVDVTSGEEITVLIPPEGTPFGMAWSPDGSRVAYRLYEVDGRISLWTVGTDGTGATSLGLDVMHDAKWSPDGTRLAFVDAADTLVVHDVTTGEQHRPRAGTVAGEVHWSPDGRGLLLTECSETCDNPGEAVIADAVGSALPHRLGTIGTVHGFASPTSVVALGGSGVVEHDLSTGSSTIVHGPLGLAFDVQIDPGASDALLTDGESRALRWTRRMPADTAPHVLLATARDFADALASGGVQGAWDAPLLLLDPDATSAAGSGVHQAVADELSRLGVQRVTLLGGAAAISEHTEGDLRAAGFTVDRLSGPTRVDTAIAVAEAAHPAPTRILLARAFGSDTDPTAAFADSLAGGAAAVAADAPLLLTDSAVLSPPLAGWLDRTPSVEEVVVLGGTAAVGTDVAAALEARGLQVTRLAGPDRLATASATTAWAREALASDDDPPPTDGVLLVLDGYDPLAWADGFAAALAADPSTGGGIVLANTDLGTIPAAMAAPLLDAPAASEVVCGTFLALRQCLDAQGVRAAATSTERAIARLTGADEAVFGDAEVTAANSTWCRTVAVEGATIETAGIALGDGGLPIPLPAPGPDGRVVDCVRTVFPDQRQVPQQVHGMVVQVVTPDGQVLEGTFTYEGA